MTKNKINITFQKKTDKWITGVEYVYITEINCSSTSSHTYIYIAVALILPENQKMCVYPLL